MVWMLVGLGCCLPWRRSHLRVWGYERNGWNGRKGWNGWRWRWDGIYGGMKRKSGFVWGWMSVMRMQLRVPLRMLLLMRERS